MSPRNEPSLHESRFWVLARRTPTTRSLPFGWSNVLWVAIVLARCISRCGLECVRVLDIRSDVAGGPRVVWPLDGEAQSDTIPPD